MKVLVSGANGFIGSAVIQRLLLCGHEPIGLIRRPIERPVDGVRYIIGPDLEAPASWKKDLNGIQAVVHTAARVHVLSESSSDPLFEFRKVNVDGTLRLAKAAAEAGVTRFVFVSSVKANGETSSPGRPFHSTDQCRPVDPYGISKKEAEEALAGLGRQTNMEITSIRPSLVYGPGVRANFEALMKAIATGFPLPLAGLTAKRSLVALDNLVDVLARCVDHREAAGKVYMVSDGNDLTVSEMAYLLSSAMGMPSRFFHVPQTVVSFLAKASGKKALAERLCMPLQVDIEQTSKDLNWSPSVGVDEAFQKTADDFWQRQRRRGL